MKLWLLGDPIAHSKSPQMHQAAYAHMGLSWEFSARRVAPEKLAEELHKLHADNTLGGNLTIPHKQLVLPLLQRATERVQVMGAANTLRRTETGWEGDNTDGPGWLDSWDEEIGEPLAGRPAIILGAGGAAKAILWALQSRGVRDITVLNRTPGKAANSGALSEFAQILRPNTVVVQTTSVGMWPNADATPVTWPNAIPEKVVACDLIYNPSPTLFLRQAAKQGAKTLGGIGMLVHQAARAIRWWSDREDVPTTLMRETLVQALS